jgi:hypothetical protein
MEPTNTIQKKRIVRKPKATATTTAQEQSKAPEKPSCQICLEPYNKVANTEVKCCFCQVSSCRRCIQTYVTTSTNDAHCMHCKRAFDRDFLDDNLTATF